MRRLLNLETGPPVDAEGDSFRFIHPETGHKSAAADYWSWIAKIKDHIRGNGLTMPDDVEAVAQDQLCATLPPHLCVYETGDPPPTDTRITFERVSNWVKAVATKVFTGEPYVDQAEAERRANICVACPYNVLVMGGCGGGCQKIVELFTPGMAKLKTEQDTRLKSCAICGCYNRVAVHFPLALLDSSDTASPHPSWCWKVE